MLRHGIFLLLLGLLTGFLMPVVEDPVLGLLSHFAGILGGTILVALGLVWPGLRLSAGMLRTAGWLAIYGAYTSWATTLFAAWFGAGASLLIAAEGVGDRWQERVILAGLLSFAASLVVVCWIVLWGLRGRTPGEEPPGPGP